MTASQSHVSLRPFSRAVDSEIWALEINVVQNETEIILFFLEFLASLGVLSWSLQLLPGEAIAANAVPHMTRTVFLLIFKTLDYMVTDNQHLQ